MADSSTPSHENTASSATSANDGIGRAANTLGVTRPTCPDCVIQHYRDTLERERLNMLDIERVRMAKDNNALRGTLERLRQQYDLSQNQTAQLHTALIKRAGDLQTEHQARLHAQSLWAGERESREKLEIQLDQTLMTLRQLAAWFHISLVDRASLTPDQKEALKKMEYAEVVLERDALKAQCTELRSTLARSRPAHQAHSTRSVA